MKTDLIVKINFLILGLVLTIFVMFQLNIVGLPQGILDLFGATGVQKPQSAVINLCKTRVVKVQFLNKNILIFEKGRRWIQKGSDFEQLLGPVKMEKWLSRHCIVSAKQLQVSSPSTITETVRFDYIKGASEELGVLARSDTFLWRGRTYVSTQLSSALKKLTTQGLKPNF